MTIKIHPSITSNHFGISEKLFQSHIQGQELEVLHYEKGFYSVLVHGDVYTVCQSDIDRAHHEFNKKDDCVVEALKR